MVVDVVTAGGAGAVVLVLVEHGTSGAGVSVVVPVGGGVVVGELDVVVAPAGGAHGVVDEVDGAVG